MMTCPFPRAPALFFVLVLILATTATCRQQQVQSVTPTTKAVSRHACSRIVGCDTCARDNSKAIICTRCKTGAILVNGRCACPEGHGAHGSRNTIRDGQRISTNGESNTSMKKASASSIACAPCTTNTFANGVKLIQTATCAKCVAGTSAAQGASTCLVPAGSYFDPTARKVMRCPGENRERFGQGIRLLTFSTGRS
jgi:hypothetical protein